MTDNNVIDVVPDDESSALALPPSSDEPTLDNRAMKMLERAGYIVPVAAPRQLREASALKQRIYAAILDERDYMYTVSYKTNDKGRESTRQWLTMNRAEAIERANALNGVVGAKPKKSGIVKLARALGIVCRPILREERTVRGVLGFYVVYEAAHAGTGLSEEGVGWCDPSERYGNMSIHDMIGTADTRAYNRAVLRLSGFGDVSADEIIAGASSEEPLPEYVPEPVETKPLAALPPPNDDKVLTASRIWAEHVARRQGDRFAAEAQQDNLEARSLRARARRGDEGAAQKLGVLGLHWKGSAQDGRSQPVFDVEAPPIKPEDVKLAEGAVFQTLSIPQGAPKSNGESEKDWDLSGKGSPTDDEPPLPEAEHSTSAIPQPHPNAETITTGQAKKVSQLLLSAFGGDKDKARQWLKTEARVDGSVHLRTNQYSAVVSTLQKKTEEA